MTTQAQPKVDAKPNQQDKLSKRWVLSLDEVEGADLALIGGKSFRLAQLKQHGFNVPQGLVLTTNFFETQIHHAKLTPLWAGSPDIAVTAEALNWLSDALKTKPLAKELSQSLNTRLTEIFGPEITGFVVRSSVIDEDQRDHTFAGIHLTELGVPRSAIPIAITRCWASALHGPAVEYRQVHGMSIQGIQIAVLIQPMLTPATSGVGFTVNPLTGARDEMIIEATWGTGNALVSGEIQPYFYRISNHPPKYPLLEQKAGNVTPPAHLENNPQASPLSSTDITELAQQFEQIQVLMGEAQDIEWAKQDNAFFLLQTRPVAVNVKTEKLIDREWTRGNRPEDVPELPSPLFGALLERTQNQALIFFEDIGLTLDNLGPYEKIILGRPYLNLTFLKRGMAQVGINPDSFLQTLGYARPTTTGNVFSIDWKTAWQGRKVYRLAIKRILSMQHHVVQTEAVVKEATRILAKANPNASSASLIDQFRQQDRIYRALFTTNLGLTLAIGFITGLGSRLIASLTQTPATAINALASAGIETEKDKLHHALRSLGNMAQEHEPIKAFFEGPADELEDYAHNPTLPNEFKHSFEALLNQYGQRSMYEADPGWPRYRDDPVLLLNFIRQYIKAGPAAAINTATVTWQTAMDLRPAIAARRWAISWRRWLTQPLVNRLHRLLKMRSQLDDVKAAAIATCRQWNLGLGKKWVEQGWLEQPNDVFWLTLDEIERALMIQKGGAVTLSSSVKARKETYKIYAQTEMPFYLKESELASIQLGVGPSAGSSSDVTIGLPISPGQARGTVMVVKNLDEFEKLTDDDIILVMPSTDPAWLALLNSAAGLIVETGGLLSHGSVIAREYGLPAVANIPQATQRFHTGDKVLVDGSTGVVQLLESGQTVQSMENE